MTQGKVSDAVGTANFFLIDAVRTHFALATRLGIANDADFAIGAQFALARIASARMLHINVHFESTSGHLHLTRVLVLNAVGA